jgi:hypothetical protein
MSPEFHDLVDDDGLGPEERARLERVHELLVQAGPPPDLPPALARPPTAPPPAEIVQFPLLPRRRAAVAVLVAAAVAAAAFGGGYLLSNHKRHGFQAISTVPMRGTAGALATLRLGRQDSVGNWPMELVVTGLPTQPDGAYYELLLTRNGKPTAPCGGFRVNSKTTRVRFTVPYRLQRFDGWVVAVWPRGAHKPGRVVLST